jgi:hypothetical protein
MSDKDWEKFFELLTAIVNGDGAWREKAEEVRSKSDEHDARASLEEFAGWAEVFAAE